MYSYSKHYPLLKKVFHKVPKSVEICGTKESDESKNFPVLSRRASSRDRSYVRSTINFRTKTFWRKTKEKENDESQTCSRGERSIKAKPVEGSVILTSMNWNGLAFCCLAAFSNDRMEWCDETSESEKWPKFTIFHNLSESTFGVESPSWICRL